MAFAVIFRSFTTIEVIEMPRDTELDRLKAAQDLAFQRKQDAYQVQQRAWERRDAAREPMNRAHGAMQAAYTQQDRTWKHYRSVKQANGPRIDSLNAQQQRAYESMRQAFQSASDAHDRRDGAAAATYAAEGRSYKAESQRYVAERRGLVADIRTARALHDAAKADFVQAKTEFERRKSVFDTAKREHERAGAEFGRAKAEHVARSRAFQDRLRLVRAEAKKRRDDRKAIAAKAGVPPEYQDNVYVSRGRDGYTNIYFGGVGKPDGPGHGHYVMDARDTVTYRRNPFDPHGAHNFEGPGKDGHRGGFGKSHHGWVGDHAVTFALGWGTRQGHTLMADGHLTQEQFRESQNHDHYGPGDGPNNNGTLRRKYTGPGA